MTKYVRYEIWDKILTISTLSLRRTVKYLLSYYLITIPRDFFTPNNSSNSLNKANLNHDSVEFFIAISPFEVRYK